MCKDIHHVKSLNDAELIDLLAQSNREAFNEIYDRYWLKLYSIAGKRIDSAEDAKDIVQDVFFSMWTRRETLIITNSLSSYLFASIKYKIINYIEANLVKNNYLNSINNAVSNYHNNLNDELNHKELQEILESGLNNLSPKVKEVFELSRNEHMSINDIAKKFNVSQQTIKNQISKAIKSLRLHVNNSSASIIILPVFLA